MAVLPGLTLSLAVFGLDLSGDVRREIADPLGRRGCAVSHTAGQEALRNVRAH